MVRSRIPFDIWFYFEGKDTRPDILDTMNEFPEFFRFAPHAHFVAFVVTISALFEKRTDTINLPQLTKEMKSSQLLAASVSAEIDALLATAAPIASKVAVLRNKAFAHRDAHITYADVFKMAAVTPDQLRDQTDVALKIANRLLIAQGLSEQFFNPLPREHAGSMLETLKQDTNRE